jgi:hypothetical protein
MNGKQRAVLWIGLLLIGLNLVMKWKDIVSVIFSGAGVSAPDTGSGSTGSGRHSVTVPIDPILPTGPKITIPLPF